MAESAPNPEAPSLAQQDLQTGKKAFEAGQYRASINALEKSLGSADPGTKIHGEAMIWLVTAYEAAGHRQQAKELCRLATRHPQYEARKEGKRLLYILEAPALRRREEWLTQIPDLEEIDEKTDDRKWGGSKFQTNSTSRPIVEDEGYQIPPPTDPSQVETEDNGFVWVVLIAITLMMGGLVWFGLKG